MGLYIVTLKDGSTYRGDSIDHLPGFIKIMRGKRELRIPSGEVAKIDNSQMRQSFFMKTWSGYIFIFLVVFFSMLFIMRG